MEVPEYKELSIKSVWPKFKDDKYLLQFLPDIKDDQLPEREYFYGILATVYEKETRELVFLSRKSRAISEKTMQNDKVAIDSEILKEIENVMSRRSKFELLCLLTLT